MRFQSIIILSLYILSFGTDYLFCESERYISFPGPQSSSFACYIVPMGSNGIVRWPNLTHKYDPDNNYQEFSKDIEWYLNQNDAKDLTFN